MAPPEDPVAAALPLVETYCHSRVPERYREELLIECSRRGRSITIVERRPPWTTAVGPEWTTMRVAQLRYDATAARWSLHAADRNGRWMPYDFVEPARDVIDLLAEIERDPTCIFWG